VQLINQPGIHQNLHTVDYWLVKREIVSDVSRAQGHYASFWAKPVAVGVQRCWTLPPRRRILQHSG